eukprot:3450-Pelagococcus_subviridis.AAC.1
MTTRREEGGGGGGGGRGGEICASHPRRGEKIDFSRASGRSTTGPVCAAVPTPASRLAATSSSTHHHHHHTSTRASRRR